MQNAILSEEHVPEKIPESTGPMKQANSIPVVDFLPVELARIDGASTLTARFDRLLARLITEEMVKGKSVAIKVHLGGSETYTCIHPAFMRRVVQRVQQAGGSPFLVDSGARYNPGCGFTYDTLGCLVHPAAGLNDQYRYVHKTGLRFLPTVEVGGFIQDADVLINLSHAKGHGHCAYGGALKNLAMGAVTGATRRAGYGFSTIVV